MKWNLSGKVKNFGHTSHRLAYTWLKHCDCCIYFLQSSVHNITTETRNQKAWATIYKYYHCNSMEVSLLRKCWMRVATQALVVNLIIMYTLSPQDCDPKASGICTRKIILVCVAIISYLHHRCKKCKAAIVTGFVKTLHLCTQWQGTVFTANW